MNKMKFAVNHWWKFNNYRVAFYAGLLQTTTIMYVEIVNITVILIQHSIIEIVMNFMAIVVISQFGNFFYLAFTEREWKEVITEKKYEKLLIIQTTTSYVARYKIDGNKIKPQKCEREWIEEETDFPNEGAEAKPRLPTYIRIEFFGDRTCCNKLLYLLYKIFRLFYVVFWFYFLLLLQPFLAIVFILHVD